MKVYSVYYTLYTLWASSWSLQFNLCAHSAAIKNVDLQKKTIGKIMKRNKQRNYILNYIESVSDSKWYSAKTSRECQESQWT